MVIVIAIRDVWHRYGDDSRVLSNVGIKVEEVVQLAFGFAAISCQTSCLRTTSCDIVGVVSELLRSRRQEIEIVGTVDKLEQIKQRQHKVHTSRLPFMRQSGYGHNDPEVFRIVDIVGEISHMLVDAVIRQVGHFPPKLRLLKFIGKDLVLTYPGE